MSQQVCTYADQCGILNKCVEMGTKMICQHDPSLPGTTYTGFIYGITPIFLGIGILGGLGGGVLKGPIILMLLNYDQTIATNIAYCLMFGGSFVNFFFLIFDKQKLIKKMLKRNPNDSKRTLINYDLAMILNTSLTLGCALGGILNIFLPDFYVNLFQQIFLICVLPYLLKQSVQPIYEKIKSQKYQKNLTVQQRQTIEQKQIAIALPQVEDLDFSPVKENQEKQNLEKKEQLEQNYQTNPQEVLENNYQQAPNAEQNQEDPEYNRLDSQPNQQSNQIQIQWEKKNPESDKILLDLQKTDQQTIPIVKFLIIFGFFIVTVIFMNVMTELQRVAKLPSCFKIDYIMLILCLVINIPLSYCTYLYGQKIRKQKILVNYNMNEDYFTTKKFIILYFSGWLSGLVSGLIGLGSGLVMIPAMLYLGVAPQVATSTSAFNYFWMGLTNLIYLMKKRIIPIEDVLFFLALALIGGSLVTRTGYYFIKKYKAQHVAVFFCFLLGFSNLISGIYYITVKSENFGFQSLLKFKFSC